MEVAAWADYFVAEDSATVDDSLRQLYAERFEDSRFRERLIDGFTDGHTRIAHLSADGNALARARIGLPRDIAEVPYWGSWARVLGVRASDRIVAATNLRYRLTIHSLDGQFVDSIGQPPDSWKQAPELARGAFASDDSVRIRRYLQGISVLTGLHAIGDSVLIVAYGAMVTPDREPHLAVHGAGTWSRYLVPETRHVGFLHRLPAHGVWLASPGRDCRQHQERPTCTVKRQARRGREAG